MALSRRTIAVLAVAGVVVAGSVAVGATVAANQPQQPAAASSAPHSPVPTPTPTPTPSYRAPSAEVVAALPEAKYDAVIDGLLPFRARSVPAGMRHVDTIAADAPLYGADRSEPVARLAAKNFLGQDTVVVPVRTEGAWSLVLTPARRTLPSADPDAPAQTAAWIRSSLLTQAQKLSSHILVDVGAQTVSIVGSDGTVEKSFPAGVGANGTPTPIGVGYMEARYLDPAQDQTVYPIGLTSLHSAAADEPFGGTDGGLIGIHYQPDHSGAVSHGCVRLDGPSISALDELPLGTPVVMTD